MLRIGEDNGPYPISSFAFLNATANTHYTSGQIWLRSGFIATPNGLYPLAHYNAGYGLPTLITDPDSLLALYIRVA